MKLLYIGDNGYKVFSKGYRLYRCFADGAISHYSNINDKKNALLSCTRLGGRFFRAEITRFYKLADGTELCIARKSIFRKTAGDKSFNKCFAVPRGSRPMNICEDNGGTLYFGEYFSNRLKKEVHIYTSEDKGVTWRVKYTFPEGNINHVHGIFKDKYSDKLWVLTGDRENECIIGYSEDGFVTFKEVFRDGQNYRSCALFFYKDFIVFATDSQYQKNFIKKFDRKTLEISTLQAVQGPVIKGTQCGNLSVISTDVEPSDVNKDTKAYVWYSPDGINWKTLYSAEKDCWHPTLFQYGAFDLPNYDCDETDTIYVTGKALKMCDGKILEFSK